MMISTTYIKSFSIVLERNHLFPFNIPAVQFAKEINTAQPVTIFIGDNGCGKSTLLETIAFEVFMGLP